MTNRAIREKKPIAGQDNSNSILLNRVTSGAAPIPYSPKGNNEDPELRKRVDARTEYLNSIKLLLS